MKPKFTRLDIQGILRGSGLDFFKAREATTWIIEALSASLAAAETVELRGLGTLEPRERRARAAHNPRTLAPVQVPDRLTIIFRPSGKLKKALNS
ncbi:MAG: HU family DNA-binding protein [Treponema sp.]|jgi:nucleoid DNA-binding protein|nr:HU family DNA-binding protein [Treponema sp.]